MPTAPTRLRVSDNRRHLVREDGTPFFYLGDTAWELFHHLSYTEAEFYLRNRAALGFTVIQAVVLAELDGLNIPNPLGHTPLIDNDPAQPNEAYFRDVDRVVELAGSLGLVIGMLPTWGDKWHRKWGVGPEIFTPDNARAYGRFLGSRYREKPIIWILGGDRPIENEAHLHITRAMAEGIREGDDGRHLITFHPNGRHSSSEWLHDEAWLDFNMMQTGHHRTCDVAQMIASDYGRTPIKPALNGEPCYEHISNDLKRPVPEFMLDDYDTRIAAYTSLFTGAFGHTYGCNEVWQMWSPGRKPQLLAHRPWFEVLDLPGAQQMRYVRWLMESRPMLTRIPDQSLLAGEQPHAIRATRDEACSYAMIYTPFGAPISVARDRLHGKTVHAWWYDPRYGTATWIGESAGGEEQQFTPPGGDRQADWILVLDDPAKEYPVPAPGRPVVKG